MNNWQRTIARSDGKWLGARNAAKTKKMQTRPPDGIDFEWRTVETEVVDFQHSMVQVAQL